MNKNHYLKSKRMMAVLLSVFMLISTLPGMSLAVYAEEQTLTKSNSTEEHYISFASDRHGSDTSIEEAMSGMKDDVEYVSIIGDMVGSGSGSGKAPGFNSSDIYNEIMSLGFAGVQSVADMSILWADHDVNVIDDAEDSTGKGIVFGMDGTDSGLMKTGYNSDGSVAYYIYGIAFYDINDNDSAGTSGEEKAAAAAAEFEDWVDTVTDHTIPIIVACHVPLHYARKDNTGAVIWSKALNYAATGSETTEAGAAVTRNVVFFHGHNHTTESKTGSYSGEFYIPCGAKMEVGATSDVWSNIYYTYTTAGYLKQNTTATQVTIDEDTVDLDKYQKGKKSDNVYDSTSKKSGAFASEFVTSGENEITRVQQVETVMPDGFSVTYTDSNGGSVKLTESGTIGLTPGKVTAKFSSTSGMAKITVSAGDSSNDAKQLKLNSDGTYTFDLDDDKVVQVTASSVDTTVSGVKTSYTYTGSAIKPAVTVTAGGVELVKGTDYTVSYSNCTNAGTATIAVNGIGNYAGLVKKTFKITKAANPITVKGKTVKLKRSVIKKKNKTYKRSALITVSKAQGTVTYAKVKGNKKITINKKTGKVKVKKGLKKGTYKVKVKVVAAGNSNYKAKTKYVWFKIKVK